MYNYQHNYKFVNDVDSIRYRAIIDKENKATKFLNSRFIRVEIITLITECTRQFPFQIGKCGDKFRSINKSKIAE